MPNMEETGRRQQAGFACAECRRRKARCDRARPRCGYCQETDTVCIVIDKTSQRGPKKGHMTALRSRIENLQWQLSQQEAPKPDNRHAPPPANTMSEWDPHAGQAPQELEIDCGELDFSGLQETDLSNMCFPSAPLAIKSASPVDMGRPFWATPGLPVDNSGLAMTTMSTDMRSMPSDLYSSEPNYSYSTMPITPPAENKEMIMTDIMRADLDQVFFERVYPVIPIIYHRRYFSWADKEYPGANRACLRSAMRVMAAAMSAPGRQFCDQLYTETRDLLEAQRIESKADISVEYVQAWLLLAHYELLRVGEYQAMLTAGRCLRLVLMARLSDIDASGADGGDASPVLINRDSVRGDTFSIVEEQRRVFWVSFCLDRSLCLRNEYPLTLQEDMIRVRLPAPEANFQNNQSIRVAFLPEAIAAPQNSIPPLSSFAECILSVTLHGHCLALQRSPSSPDSSASSPGETPSSGGAPFWTQRKQLAMAVETRLRVLSASQHSSSRPLDADPMLLFAHMLAHSAVIRLGHAAQRSPSLAGWRSVDNSQGQGQGNGTVAPSYRNRGLSAAAEIVHLARQIPSFSAVCAHPFLPDPVGCAVGYLANPTNATAGTVGGNGTEQGGGAITGTEGGIQDLLRLLRAMQDKNALASAYLDGTWRDTTMSG